MKALLASTLAVFLLTACQSRAVETHPNASETASKSNGSCKVIRGDTSGGGKNIIYRCSNAQAVLNAATAQGILKSSIPVSFGSGGTPVTKGQGLVTRQAANGVGKSDSDTCERALINAASKFQDTAAKLGGSRVTGFHSYFDRKPLHGGQYDCQAGTFHARVVMRADVVR